MKITTIKKDIIKIDFNFLFLIYTSLPRYFYVENFLEYKSILLHNPILFFVIFPL